MARLEVGTAQLSFESPTTVIVVHGRQGTRSSLEQFKPRTSLEVPILNPDVVRAAIQGYLQFGPDDADSEGKITQFRRAAIESGAKFEDINRDTAQTALETGLEGSRMGRPAARLVAAHLFLMEQAEDALTTPGSDRKAS